MNLFSNRCYMYTKEKTKIHLLQITAVRQILYNFYPINLDKYYSVLATVVLHLLKRLNMNNKTILSFSTQYNVF